MNKSVYQLLHALIVSIIISVPLTLVMLAVNVGFDNPEFGTIYLRSFLIAVAVATPVSLFAGPLGAKILTKAAPPTQS
ncbi:DUF2798 domain-containing protein [Leucobacter coleopterorum]|uniref:DUF2798 domain-containing protein n=1 Tax=Leucobacter coleopterorum TaxID=2714933 RepID=A0ABX6JYJ4_9MICO|nr:DUF2798 domain-containing protein [Leucobacter coleopterorum]QIM19386.1 DUF2798 domain-containing protein [Leucobacter coleopterorum]